MEVIPYRLRSKFFIVEKFQRPLIVHIIVKFVLFSKTSTNMFFAQVESGTTRRMCDPTKELVLTRDSSPTTGKNSWRFPTILCLSHTQWLIVSSELMFESIDLINPITTMMTTMSFVSRQQQIKMFNSINSLYFGTNLFD